MFLAASVILFAVFFGNVVMGAAELSILLTDVQELLVLLAASTCFVVEILKREAAKKRDQI